MKEKKNWRKKNRRKKNEEKKLKKFHNNDRIAIHGFICGVAEITALWHTEQVIKHKIVNEIQQLKQFAFRIDLFASNEFNIR